MRSRLKQFAIGEIKNMPCYRIVIIISLLRLHSLYSHTHNTTHIVNNENKYSIQCTEEQRKYYRKLLYILYIL